MLFLGSVINGSDTHSSDIASFYKEELAGEQANYVHDRAYTTSSSPEEVLQELVQEVIAATRKARNILCTERERYVWEAFATGYLVFHVYTSSRYRLHELEIF